MFDDIAKSYELLANDIKADGIIPSGMMFEELLKRGITRIHRDSFYASFGLGRYSLGLLWYRILSNRNVKNIDFNDFDEGISNEEIETIKDVVDNIG